MPTYILASNEPNPTVNVLGRTYAGRPCNRGQHMLFAIELSLEEAREVQKLLVPKGGRMLLQGTALFASKSPNCSWPGSKPSAKLSVALKFEGVPSAKIEGRAAS